MLVANHHFKPQKRVWWYSKQTLTNITNFLPLAQGSRWGYTIRDCQQRNPMKNPLIFTSKMIFLANPTNFASQTSGSPILAVQTCCPFSERNLAATFFTKNASLISLNGEHRQQTEHLIGRHVWIDRQKDIKLERLIWKHLSCWDDDRLCIHHIGCCQEAWNRHASTGSDFCVQIGVSPPSQ